MLAQCLTFFFFRQRFTVMAGGETHGGSKFLDASSESSLEELGLATIRQHLGISQDPAAIRVVKASAYCLFLKACVSYGLISALTEGVVPRHTTAYRSTISGMLRPELACVSTSPPKCRGYPSAGHRLMASESTTAYYLLGRRQRRTWPRHSSQVTSRTSLRSPSLPSP